MLGRHSFSFVFFRLSAAVLLCLALTPGAALCTRPTLMSLEAVAPTGYLARAYGLGLAPLPKPPDIPAVPVQEHCPLEIRGIWQSDTPLALVAVGDESYVLEAGQGVRTGQGWVAISMIFNGMVVVHMDGRAFACPLGLAEQPATEEQTE